MIKTTTVIKTMSVCLGLFGLTQADLVDVHKLHQTQQWQSLGKEVSNDGIPSVANGVNVWDASESKWVALTNDFTVEAGTTVKFQIDMYKEYQGTHTFDAMKVWIDDGATDLFVDTTRFNLVADGKTITKPKSGINKTTSYYDGIANIHEYYEFSYKFDNEGSFDLTARVTCSDDLSKMASDGSEDMSSKYWCYGYNWATGRTEWFERYADRVTTADWNAWTKDVVMKGNGQGEAERYKITVHKTNVPEPTMLSLLGCSLIGLFFIRRKK